MENSSFIKQAKSDIFKELYTIINFYIKKGAKPQALKKYYRNSKRFNDILEDIKNKGINLVKDESEYKNLVKQVLNEILDDFIAKEKDEEYKNKQTKMKHIKMKHVKKFENWTTDITGDYEVNYGEPKLKISDFIKELGDYIDDAIKKEAVRADFLNKQLCFRRNIPEIDIDNISINNKGEDHLYIKDANGNYYNFDLNKEEYKFLYNIMRDIYRSEEIKRQEKEKTEILSRIYGTDKYNL